MFAGYADLDSPFAGLVVTGPPSGPPAVPDAAPTWQVYGPAGPMPNGTGVCTQFDVDPGLYAYRVSVSGSSGYEIATTYRVVFRYALGGQPYLDTQTFMVT